MTGAGRLALGTDGMVAVERLNMEKKTKVKKIPLKKTKNAKEVKKMSKDIFFAICEDIADGLTVQQACADAGVSYRSFRRFVDSADVNNDGHSGDSSSEFYQVYARAREWRGEACLMRIDDIMRKLADKEIDSTTARVMIDTEKWKAAKFYPKMYGDMTKTQFVDDKGDGYNPFEAFYKKICEEKDYTR